MTLPRKDPPPTQDELQAVYVAVNNGIDQKYPYGTGPYGGYPQAGPVEEPFYYVGPTQDTILQGFLTLIGYQNPNGTPADNARARTQVFVVDHAAQYVVSNALCAGLPIPPRDAFVPPPLQISFSESQIEARLTETPPRNYAGAPLSTDAWVADNVTAAQLAMRADPAYGGMLPGAIDVLCRSFWGKGQTYYPVNFDPNWASGKTAAEIFWQYDVGTRNQALQQGITGPSL